MKLRYYTIKTMQHNGQIRYYLKSAIAGEDGRTSVISPVIGWKSIKEVERYAKRNGILIIKEN